MARKYLILIIGLALILFIFTGCKSEKPLPEEEPLTGKDVPEYKILLDPVVLTQSLRDELEAASEEDRKLLEKINDGIGALDWQLVNLEAKEDKGTIGVRSVTKFTGKDDSFFGYMSKVEPVRAMMIKGFTRDNLLGIFASGNVEGGMDALAKWAFDTRTIDNIMKASGGGMVGTFSWNAGKAALVQLSEIMKEELYPYLGDEFALVGYYNDDFIGFDDISDAETITETSPVRVIIALSLGKKGLAKEFPDILESMVSSATMGMISGFGGPMSLFPEVEKKKGDGYNIYYFDMAGEFQIAWVEYEGALFISDMDTIENIAKYYDPAKPAAGVPPRYNFYFQGDIDNCVSKFIVPYNEDILNSWKRLKS